MSEARASATEIARAYYDSEDADNFYAAIWGGEDIHIGLYENDKDSIRDASRRTVLRMAEKVSGIARGARVLDIGSGYGGAARVLAGEYGANVTCLNLSSVENQRNEILNREQGLSEHIRVVDGSFDDIPEDDCTFDIVWSQDAILHAADRSAVLQEVARILKPGGEFIFTDPMQTDGLADTTPLQPIYDRIHLQNLASFGFYRRELDRLGLCEIGIEDLSPQLRTHYARVGEELTARRTELSGEISDEYIERMIAGLQHWVRGADAGLLAWGVMHFQKR